MTCTETEGDASMTLAWAGLDKAGESRRALNSKLAMAPQGVACSCASLLSIATYFGPWIAVVPLSGRNSKAAPV